MQEDEYDAQKDVFATEKTFRFVDFSVAKQPAFEEIRSCLRAALSRH